MDDTPSFEGHLFPEDAKRYYETHLTFPPHVHADETPETVAEQIERLGRRAYDGTNEEEYDRINHEIGFLEEIARKLGKTIVKG